MIHLSILLIPFLSVAMLVYYMHCFNQTNVLSKVYAAKTWRDADLNSLDSIHTELYRKEMGLFPNHRSTHYVFAISFLLCCISFKTLLLWSIGFTIYKLVTAYEKKNQTKIFEDLIYGYFEPLFQIPLSVIYKLSPQLDYDNRYNDAIKDCKL